jgi:hypothetical protein
MTWVYRLMGAAWLVVFVLWVHKHGWHVASLIFFAAGVLMFSLGVNPENRKTSWRVRYVLTVLTFVALAADRLLR